MFGNSRRSLTIEYYRSLVNCLTSFDLQLRYISLVFRLHRLNKNIDNVDKLGQSPKWTLSISYGGSQQQLISRRGGGGGGFQDPEPFLFSSDI